MSLVFWVHSGGSGQQQAHKTPEEDALLAGLEGLLFFNHSLNPQTLLADHSGVWLIFQGMMKRTVISPLSNAMPSSSTKNEHPTRGTRHINKQLKKNASERNQCPTVQVEPLQLFMSGSGPYLVFHASQPHYQHQHLKLQQQLWSNIISQPHQLIMRFTPGPTTLLIAQSSWIQQSRPRWISTKPKTPMQLMQQSESLERMPPRKLLNPSTKYTLQSNLSPELSTTQPLLFLMTLPGYRLQNQALLPLGFLVQHVNGSALLQHIGTWLQ